MFLSVCVCVCGHFKVLTRRISFGFEHKSRVRRASRLGCACCGGLVSVATRRRAYEDQRVSVGEIRLTALVWQLYTSAGRTSGCSERNLRLDVDPAESARRSHRRTASAHRLCARPPTEPREVIGFWLSKNPPEPIGPEQLLPSQARSRELADPTTNFTSPSLRYVLYSRDKPLQILLLHKCRTCKITESSKLEEVVDEEFRGCATQGAQVQFLLAVV